MEELELGPHHRPNALGGTAPVPGLVDMAKAANEQWEWWWYQREFILNTGLKRLSLPILTDEGKQPMLYLVPLARAGRKVADGDPEIGLVG